jgi:hypothetical protein
LLSPASGGEPPGGDDSRGADLAAAHLNCDPAQPPAATQATQALPAA